MLENMVDPSCKRLDWACVCASALHMNGFTFDSILLVANPEGSLSCSSQLGPRRVVWDDVVVGISKGDIGNNESFSLSTLGLFGVLTNTQQVVECNVDEISNGSMFGSVRTFALLCLADHVFGQAHRNSQLGFGLGISLFVGGKQLFQSPVVVSVAAFGVGDVPFRVQFADRSNGRYRCLY